MNKIELFHLENILNISQMKICVGHIKLGNGNTKKN